MTIDSTNSNNKLPCLAPPVGAGAFVKLGSAVRGVVGAGVVGDPVGKGVRISVTLGPLQV